MVWTRFKYILSPLCWPRDLLHMPRGAAAGLEDPQALWVPPDPPQGQQLARSPCAAHRNPWGHCRALWGRAWHSQVQSEASVLTPGITDTASKQPVTHPQLTLRPQPREGNEGRPRTGLLLWPSAGPEPRASPLNALQTAPAREGNCSCSNASRSAQQLLRSF